MFYKKCSIPNGRKAIIISSFLLYKANNQVDGQVNNQTQPFLEPCQINLLIPFCKKGIYKKNIFFYKKVPSSIIDRFLNRPQYVIMNLVGHHVLINVRLHHNSQSVFFCKKNRPHTLLYQYVTLLKIYIEGLFTAFINLFETLKMTSKMLGSIFSVGIRNK